MEKNRTKRNQKSISNQPVKSTEQKKRIQIQKTASNDTIQDTKYIDFLIAEYQVLSESRTNHNSLLWSIPSLCFVAQAALWQIAFTPVEEPFIRIVISFFSIFVGIASWQCFLRNRLMEIADAEQAYIIECAFKEKYGTDIDFPIPILYINHKLRNRTWFKVDEKNFIIAEPSKPSEPAERSLKDFINMDKRVKGFWYKIHSSNIWKCVFVFSILLPIINLLYMLYTFLTT